MESFVSEGLIKGGLTGGRLSQSQVYVDESL